MRSESCHTCNVSATHEQHHSGEVLSVRCSVRVSGGWSPSLLVTDRHDSQSVFLSAHSASSPVPQSNVATSLYYEANITNVWSPAAVLYSTQLVFTEQRRPVGVSLSATNCPSINCTRSSTGNRSVTRKTSAHYNSLTHSLTVNK